MDFILKWLQEIVKGYTVNDRLEVVCEMCFARPFEEKVTERGTYMSVKEWN